MQKQGKLPSKVSDADFDGLVQVTEANRKFCVVLGRTLYSIVKAGKTHELHGWFEIRPRLTKGILMIGNVKISVWRDDEGMNEYRDTFKGVIDLLIKDKSLYINPKEELIKYAK